MVYFLITSDQANYEFWIGILACVLLMMGIGHVIIKNARMYVNEPVSISCSVVKKIQ